MWPPRLLLYPPEWWQAPSLASLLARLHGMYLRAIINA